MRPELFSRGRQRRLRLAIFTAVILGAWWWARAGGFRPHLSDAMAREALIQDLNSQ
jgi:hypothetical protein